MEVGQEVLRADMKGEIKVHESSKLFIQNSLFRNAEHPFHTIEELSDATRFPAPVLAPGRGGDFVCFFFNPFRSSVMLHAFPRPFLPPAGVYIVTQKKFSKRQ